VIGVFDSGVGGLSVLVEIRRLLPDADLLYLADQSRAPYGVRSLDEVAAMSSQVSEWLLEHGADNITIACNTASAAALHRLRATHRGIPFVGMEPAVKPAALETSSGVIGVLATAATFQGELFASVLQRHAAGMTVLTRACPAWVELVESGVVAGAEARDRVAADIAPLLAEGADTLVLGCTHFSFLAPSIAAVAGPGVAIVDPGPAVARQVGRVAGDTGGTGDLVLATSGDPDRFARLAHDLAGIRSPHPVLACTWNEPA
jgi:glutamate racemase